MINKKTKVARGRKRSPKQQVKAPLTLVKRNGRHMLSGEIDREAILAAVRSQRGL